MSVSNCKDAKMYHRNVSNNDKCKSRKKPSDSKKYYRQIADDRNSWKAEQIQACMWCGGSGGFLGLEIHEIERRSHLRNNWHDRSNILLLCGECHEKEFSTMPHIQQLAVKMLRDEHSFCLERWLDLTGRKGIDQKDVLRAAALLQQSLPDLKPRDFPLF